MDDGTQDLRWKYWDLASCGWSDGPAASVDLTVELPEQRVDEPVEVSVVAADESALQLPG